MHVNKREIMDIFKSSEVRSLLQGKTVLFMGGSVVRGLYKDFVWLLNSDSMIPYKVCFVCIYKEIVL